MRIKGIVVKNIYSNEETGFRILKAKSENITGEFGVKGTLPPVGEGSVFEADGEWIQEENYGLTLKAREFSSALPSNKEGMVQFLSSKYVKGIGAKTAETIVDRFGEDTYDVLDRNPEKLLEIKGVGKKTLKTVKESWVKQDKTRSIISFLGGYGISTLNILKIYNRFGAESTALVKKNPYILADEIKGIGFKKADEIAKCFGFKGDNPYRIRSGIRFVLDEMSGNGHTFGYETEVIRESESLLDVKREQIKKQIGLMEDEKELIRDDNALYLTSFYYREKDVAENLKRLLRGNREKKPVDFTELDTGIEYDETQKEAIQKAMDENVTIITGGPGTGKSTITKGIVRACELRNEEVLLAAPTGRAAKRLSEATGKEAMTIHRLLGYGRESGKNGFVYNEKNRLRTDSLIIDEVSMIDISLMHSLLKAVKSGVRLILIGDKDQLPSVRAGNVLEEMLESGVIPKIELTRIFRQAATSGIVSNAHRLNEGKMPKTDNSNATDFYFITRDSNGAIADEIERLVTERLPKHTGLKPEDIQILSPMKNGVAGTVSLNERIRRSTNPEAEKITVKGTDFHKNDKVMQTENDYEHEIFNGDIGTVVSVNGSNRIMKVDFEGRTVALKGEELNGLVHAYAVTVHKSQGSEYPVVVMPVTTSHYVMLNRKIMYTAFTRAKKLLVLVGMKKALAIAAKGEFSETKRNSRLGRRLKENGKEI